MIISHSTAVLSWSHFLIFLRYDSAFALATKAIFLVLAFARIAELRLLGKSSAQN
jgi:hypothetical protein